MEGVVHQQRLTRSTGQGGTGTRINVFLTRWGRGGAHGSVTPGVFKVSRSPLGSLSFYPLRRCELAPLLRLSSPPRSSFLSLSLSESRVRVSAICGVSGERARGRPEQKPAGARVLVLPEDAAVSIPSLSGLSASPSGENPAGARA